MGPKPDTHHDPRRPRPSYGSTIDPPNSNPEYGDARRPPVPPGYMNSQGPSYSNAHSNYDPYQSNTSPYVLPPPRDASYHYENYATNAHPPPPPSIAYSNSGNSSTENSRNSHNNIETSLARNATLMQSTNSTTVPLSFNVFFGDIHGDIAQPTYRHHQNDFEHHRSRQDPRRSHRPGREEYDLWNADASPEPSRRPNEPPHPPYPRSEQGSRYRDERDNHHDRASFEYNRDPQPPDGHIAEMHRTRPRPQRMDSAHSSASSSSHNAYNTEPHQTLSNVHNTAVWSQDTYGKSEETLHGSPDRRPLRKPRRPSEGSSSTDSSETVRPSYSGRSSQPSGSASTSSVHSTSADGRMSDRHHGYGYSSVDATYEDPSQLYRKPSGQNDSIDFAGKPIYENNTRASFISADRTPTGPFAFSGDPPSQRLAEQDWHRKPDSSQQPPFQLNSSNAMGPATPQHTSRHPPSIRIPGPLTHGPYTVMPIIPEGPNINELSHHMSRTSISESSYGRDHATYSSPPQSAHSISTLPDKLPCLGNPCLLPIQREKPPGRRSFRKSSLEGHVPLYMASKIIDQVSMPLWYPSPNLRAPDQTMRSIEVGDIGYLDDVGEFHTIFNIFSSYQRNIERGAHPPPQNHFNHLSSSSRDDMTRKTEIQMRQYFASSNVERRSSRSEEQFKFCLDRKERRNGAICVLPHGGVSHSLRGKFFNMPEVKEYFKHNAASWYQHAKSLHCISKLMNGSLLFVHGTHMARTWGIAAFKSPTTGRDKTKDIDFLPGNIYQYEYQWRRSEEGWNTRAGPSEAERQGRTLTLNQCIGIIATAIHLDTYTWQSYFEQPGAVPRPQRTGIGGLLSRVSSMSSIFNTVDGRRVPQYLQSLTDSHANPRSSDDYELLRMEIR